MCTCALTLCLSLSLTHTHTHRHTQSLMTDCTITHMFARTGVGNMFMPMFAFFVLPLVAMLYTTITRRDAAQHALGRLKAQVLVSVIACLHAEILGVTCIY